MGILHLNAAFSSFHLALSIVVFCSFTGTNSQGVDPLGELACKMFNCGEGICKPSTDELLHFYCECNAGWKTPTIGNVTYPGCVVPDCTVNFGCGDPAPPPPPVSLNLTDPCSLSWCGDGSCVVGNGTLLPLPFCKCNEGSYNVANLTGLPCFKECYLGADCHHGQQSPPSGLGSTQNGMSPPPPPSSSTFDPKKDGSSKGTPAIPNASRTQCTLTMTVVIAMFFSWL